MNSKIYATRKMSGSDLIGEIPEHWRVTRLRSALEFKKDTVGSKSDDHLLLSLTLRGVIPRDLENRMGKLPAEFSTYQAVDRDNLVFCLFDVEETPRTIGWVPQAGMVTGAYTATSVRKTFFPKYVAYYYLSLDQYKSLRRFYAGLRNTIRKQDFFNIPLPFPTMQEQRIIAEYLDYETAEIDAFIADEERLVKLLEERRSATITQVITKGIDPKAPLKSGGTTWLYQVPSHWLVNSFGRCVIINSGQVDPREEPYRNMFLVAPNHIESGTGKLLSLETADEQGAESGKYLVRKGQVIYSKIRPNLMKTIIAPVDCICSADMYGLSADTRQLSNEWLQFVLLSRPFHDFAVDQSMRVAMPKLNHDSLKAAPVWMPPLAEQQEILNYLHKELPKLDAAIADAREAIALSRERRAALISAAVTGKIDVRKWKSSTERVFENHGVA